ncbi:MAG TPA: YdeI/OmpD-associated family protein [Candidatus Acidoferrales bacterium]|nr:YdeI/OmpD-associated family protein [Candidatus Acidoferrales bacterium]
MRPVPPCPELARELRPYKQLQGFFASLEPSQQESINRRILEAVKKETRKRRAAQEAERLMEVMEAERELPPLISRGFAHNPDARRGWDRMSSLLRRQYLMHILHSQYPDTRERTLGYALKEFARVAGVHAETVAADYADSTDSR